MLIFQRFIVVLALFSALLTGLRPAAAAELKVNFDELTKLVSDIVKDAKLRLHNTPPGLLEFASTSSATLGQTTVPLDIKAFTFQKLGATYSYYMNDINSSAITVTSAPGAVRVTLTFEAENPEFVGRCVSGGCVADASLPLGQWSRPKVSIDLVPVALGDSISLKVKKVEVGGTPELTCRDNAGLFVGGVCKFIVANARASVNQTFATLGDTIRDKFNNSEFPAKVAEGLKKHLVLGPAGEVRIKSVAVNTQSIVVSFCLRC